MEPGDFRPISLTSFLTKIMERMVDGFLRDEILAYMSLHPNQHAYQAGKSVETVLYRLVVQVEKVLDQQETAPSVFLDTEGAFNNNSYDSICAAFFKHEIHYTNVRWIRATLEGHLTVATLGAFSKRVAVSRGCPQGGVVAAPIVSC